MVSIDSSGRGDPSGPALLSGLTIQRTPVDAVKELAFSTCSQPGLWLIQGSAAS